MRIMSVAVLGLCLAASVSAAPPAFRNTARSVTLDGVRLGDDLTPLTAKSLRFSVVYDDSTRRHHLWLLRSDAGSYPASGWALTDLLHAVSNDGVHFVSDANLSYGIGSAARTLFGASMEPPINYLRVAQDAGVWKLLVWSPNDSAMSPSRWGEYNYNTSVSELGSSAFNTVVTHQGPVRAAAPGGVGPGGLHVGAFGLVQGHLYLRVDSPTGGARRFTFSDAIAPGVSDWNAPDPEADLFAGTPYCWGLQAGCTGPTPLPAYVHNAGRTLRQADGVLATYYGFRDWVSAARLDKQIWHVESVDGGLSWSAPSGVFADGNAVSVDGQLTAANGQFSTVEASLGNGVCRVYFSTRDAAGRVVVATASTGGSCDTLFGDNFDGNL